MFETITNRMREANKHEDSILIQNGIFLGISFVVLALFWSLYLLNDQSFQPYFEGTNPLTVAGISVILGVLLLQVHLSNGWFVVYSKESRKGIITSTGLAVLFGLIIIIVDLLAVFPADINVPFPQSLLFYPAIGFVVEIIFHLLPLTVIIVLITLLAKKWNVDEIYWPVIILVSLVEPIYQAIPNFGHQVSIWTDAYIGIHIFLINLFQLWLFKRYDFVSMYLFRLVYYLIWHIGWGYLRLQLLF